MRVVEFAQQRLLGDLWGLLEVAAGALVAFNLTAVLAGVVQINSLGVYGAQGAGADLARALAVSAFLMLYGAALLAAGFWQRRRASALSQSYRLSRRRRYSSSIARTVSCGPVSAWMAAFCVIDETFDVEWLWMAPQAAMSGAGPRAQPQRQPVMA